MDELDARIESLIRANRLRDAGQALAKAIPVERGDLRDEAIAWIGRLAQTDTQRRLEELSADDYLKARAKLARQLLELRRALNEPAVPAPAPGIAADRITSVFISYSTRDTAVAIELSEALRRHGVDVRIDREAVRPGADLRDFIRESVRSTAATVCIVSEASLLSGWVAQETVLALAALELAAPRPFIACYLDDSFLDPGFRLKATLQIDARLGEIETLFPQYAANRLDTNDLNAEKSRLFELRNQLGAILERLRACLCLDLRPAARAASVERLVRSLSGPAAHA
ncbi:MAG TPA: TIR domain-containing protein [Burkholderiales bacterium]|nr:TIR domain-containing protein [Burkholderiales bacterium]